MVQSFNMRIQIVPAETVRAPDGLALSSRNTYLSQVERAAAPALYRVLTDCAARIKRGDLMAQALDEGGAAIEQAGFALDYFEARHADTLRKIEGDTTGPFRLLVAARIGRTRLIDNIAV
jgi:pantoate--beta-alanine ligase